MLPASSAEVLAISSSTTTASAVQFPHRRHLLTTFQFFQFSRDARGNRNHPDQSPCHVGAQALLFQERCTIRVGLRCRQRQVEKTHRHDLAVFRIGHPHKDPDRLFNAAKFAFFGRNLLRRNRRRLEHRSCRRHLRCRCFGCFGAAPAPPEVRESAPPDSAASAESGAPVELFLKL